MRQLLSVHVIINGRAAIMLSACGDLHCSSSPGIVLLSTLCNCATPAYHRCAAISTASGQALDWLNEVNGQL
jgi:hypothetical protein